jgi:hypothetical protein
VSILPIGRKGCENPNVIVIRFNSPLVFTRNIVGLHWLFSSLELKNHWQSFTLSGINILPLHTSNSIVPTRSNNNEAGIRICEKLYMAGDDNSQTGSQPKNVGDRQLLCSWFMQNGLHLNRLPCTSWRYYKLFTKYSPWRAHAHTHTHTHTHTNTLIHWPFDVKTHLQFTAGIWMQVLWPSALKHNTHSHQLNCILIWILYLHSFSGTLTKFI